MYLPHSKGYSAGVRRVQELLPRQAQREDPDPPAERGHCGLERALLWEEEGGLLVSLLNILFLQHDAEEDEEGAAGGGETGKTKKHILCVNTYQMVLLLMFNTRDKVIT